MKKVSFDFDSTLDIPTIREFAKNLVDKGIEVHIVTSRLSDEEAPNKDWNKNVWETCDYCGINKNHVHFTAYEDKYKFFLREEGFIWHLDDDWIELEFLEEYTDVIGVSHFGNNWTKGNDTWRETCLNLLEDNEKDLVNGSS